MAAALYDSGREGFLSGSLDWDTQDIKIVLTDHTDATPNVSTDNALDDISAGTVDTSPNLGSKTTTGGVADAANVTFTSVTGDAADSFSSYYDSTVAATSLLIHYDDAATGLPVTPNGGDITITWADTGLDGAGGIFKL